MEHDALRALGIETGDPYTAAFTAGAQMVSTLAPIAAGVPQKEVRIARANRDAAYAARDAAKAQLEAAQLMGSGGSPAGGALALGSAPASGVMGMLAAPSPIFNLPWGVAAPLAGLAVWGLVKLVGK